ncbi:MAG: 30S ribosomal protein S16 [Bacteroidales bacterium]
MPTKIRLQRKGKKGQPFYHIVIADGRAPRDGKFIEKIGTYNPLTKPAGINLDFDKAIQWLQNGAQPTDTARAILSYKGVMYKNHLLKGVQKGALTLEQVEEKFKVWQETKEASIQHKINQEDLEKKNKKKKQLENEMKINEAIAAKVAEKRAVQFAAENASTAAEEVEAPQAEAVIEPEAEVVAEVEAVETIEAEAPEEPVAEEPVAEEPVAEEPVAEEPAAEEPAAEEPAAEEPAAEDTTEEEKKED